MLQDQSPEKINTISFLERRLNDFQTFGSVQNTVNHSHTLHFQFDFFSRYQNLYQIQHKLLVDYSR
jgi:hypothetical protein